VTVTLKDLDLAEVIPVLHSMAEATASDESDGVARQEEEHIGICTVWFSILVSDQEDVKIISPYNPVCKIFEFIILKLY
jgi:hypothetical protein